MRIIGGEYKGRIFKPGKTFKARPTTDVAKEGLFNILENRFDLTKLKVLDLFSGTGSISYEFASRGCNHILAVEQNFNHYKFILKVISELNIQSITPIKGDVFKFLGKCTTPFDLIFADPPYNLKNLERLPDLVVTSKAYGQGSLFILEHPKNYHFNKHSQFQELRRYGSVHFSFFKNLKH